MAKFLVVLLFLAICALGALEGAVISKNAKRIEKTYVESFIKFKSVQEPGESFPTIEPIGCSPTNNDADDFILANETIVLHDFQFLCHKDEHGNLDFEPIRCIDPFGEKMKNQEKRLLSNGTVVLECRVEGATLKKVYERASGCMFNGSVYSAEDTWIEGGVLKQCFNVRFSYHEVHTIGCSINSTPILFGEIATLDNGTSLKCLEDGFEKVKFEQVTVDDFQCEKSFGAEKVAHNLTFQEDDVEYKCSFGKLEKIGCVINGKTLPVGRMATLSNDCYLGCLPSEPILICPKIPTDAKIVEILEKRIPGITVAAMDSLGKFEF